MADSFDHRVCRGMAPLPESDYERGRREALAPILAWLDDAYEQWQPNNPPALHDLYRLMDVIENAAGRHSASPAFCPDRPSDPNRSRPTPNAP